MQFSLAPLCVLVLAAAQAFAATATVSYDTTYDVASTSLDEVACSDGPNGLESKGYTTFGSLPKFPYIGGAAQIGGYGSAQCGTCWALTYNGRTINVLAIDHTDAGFNIGLNAMNALTNNQATFLGRVNASYKQVAASVCGITN